MKFPKEKMSCGGSGLSTSAIAIVFLFIILLIPFIVFFVQALPQDPVIVLNSTYGTNLTSENLTCYTTLYEDLGGNVNVTVQWFVNETLNLTIDYNNSYPNATEFNTTLLSGNTSLGDNWNCSLILYNGTDYSNWTNSSDVTIINELIPPTITISSPTNTTFATTSIDLNVTADESISVWLYSINDTANQSFIPNTSITASEGNNNIIVYANDSVGNFNSSQVYFTVDTTGPTINVTSPKNTTYSSGDIDYNITLSENISVALLSINSGSNLTMINNTLIDYYNLSGTHSTLIYGQHNATFYVNDTSGNSNTTTVYFSIDTTYPNIEFVSPTPDNGSSTINHVYVNVSTNDSSEHSAFIDWNRSLVLWLDFDYNNGTHVFDRSGYKNNGTLVNGPNFTADGKRGGAMEFDATDDYINSGNDSVLHLTGPLTTEAWIKWKGGVGSIVRRDKNHALMAGQVENVTRFWVNNGSWIHSGDSSTDIVDDQWHHVVGVYDGSYLRIYVDGVEENNSYVGTLTFPTNESSVIVGCYLNGNTSYFNGSIDEVKIWNRSLSPQEINASYQAGTWRLERNFTNLTTGFYDYTAYVIDTAGNINSTIRNVTIDNDAATVTLTSPTNDSIWNISSDITFVYNVSDSSTIQNCSLILNGTVNQTNTSITKDNNQTFDLTLANGGWNWSVSCIDSANNTGNSSTNIFTVNYHSPPIINQVILNSTNTQNNTYQNLTIYVDGEDDNNITYYGEWYRNNEIFVDQILNVTYDSGNTEAGLDLAIDDDRNMYIGGYIQPSNFDYFLIKYSSTGQEIWNATFDSGYDDRIWGVTADSSGNVYVTGQSNISGTNDCYTIKYNSTGQEIWNATYDGGDDDLGYSIDVDSSGNVYVTGWTDNGANNDIFTIKYNSNGQEVWNATLDTEANDLGYNLDIDGDRNVYVIGYSHNGANNDFHIIKYNSTGQLVWNTTFDNGGEDRGYGIDEYLGNIYITGRSHNGANNDAYTAKFNSTGQKVWNISYDNGSNDYGWGKIYVDNAENVYVGLQTENTNLDFGVVKYNSTGQELWNKTYDGGDADGTNMVTVDSSGNVYAGGWSHNGVDYDVLIMKYKNGFLLENQSNQSTLLDTLNSSYTSVGDVWQACVTPFDENVHGSKTCTNQITISSIYPTINSVILNSTDVRNNTNQNLTLYVEGVDDNNITYFGEWYKNGTIFVDEELNITYNESSYDWPRRITVDSQNNVYIAARVLRTDYDFLTFKYDSSGQEVWNVSYDSGESDYSSGIAVDSSGNVYVSGWTNVSGNHDYITIKYNSSGQEVWNATYDGGSEDYAYDSTIDSSGNLYLTGYSNISGNFDYHTIKYNSSGQEVWNATSGGSNDDIAYGIYVDNESNVYVTGNYDNGVDDDSLTIKYNSTGQEEWNITYDSGTEDFGIDVIVDSMGYIYTAGTNKMSGNRDWNVIKYNSSRDVVWNHTYDHTGNKEEPWGGIKLDSAGNVYVSGEVRNSSNVDDYHLKKYNSTGYELWNITYDSGGSDYGQDMILDSNNNIYLTGFVIKGTERYMLTIKYKDGFSLENSPNETIILDTLNSSHTSVGDVWQACVTPFDGNVHGNQTCSSNITIRSSPPVITTLFLNSTSSTNTTTQNLTIYANGTDEDNITYFGEWYVNDTVFVEEIWNTTTDLGDEHTRGIAIDSDNNVYVTGRNVTGDYDYITVKYNSTGSELWNVTFDSGISEQSRGVDVDSEGNVYVSGQGNGNIITVKYNSSGQQIWNVTFDNTSGVGMQEIVLDSSDNFYIGGYSSPSTNDLLVIKYNSSGIQIWNKTFDTGQNEFGTSVAVDSSGNVYVSGYTNLLGNNDFLAVKFNSTGDQIWNRTFDFAGQSDNGYGIDVDSLGNVYVTGPSNNSVDLDYVTIKYNSTGDLIWNRSFDRGYDDSPYGGIVVDSAGNAYIGGESSNGADLDYVTVKYNSTGDYIWNKTFDGGNDDGIHGLTVDSTGDVYVAGWTYNGADYDFHTIKYRDGFLFENYPNQLAMIDIMNSTFTSLGDVWRACVTPFDGLYYGNKSCSNNLTVILESSGSGDGDGTDNGSGGGSTGGTGNTNQNQESKTWGKIEPGTKTEMIIDNEEIPITGIFFDVSTTAFNSKITVQSLDEKPSDKPAVSGKVHNYIEILTTNLQNKLENTVISFKVPLSFLGDSPKDKIKLLRYTDKWEILVTKFISQDSNNLHYEAQTPGFSTFAITLLEAETIESICGDNVCDTGEDCPQDCQKQEKVKECVHGDTRCSGLYIQDCVLGEWKTIQECPERCVVYNNLPTCEKKIQNVINTEVNIVIVLLVIIMIVISIGVYAYMRTSSESKIYEYKPRKNKKRFKIK